MTTPARRPGPRGPRRHGAARPGRRARARCVSWPATGPRASPTGWAPPRASASPSASPRSGTDSVVVADIFNHAIREVRLDGRVRTIVGGPDRKGYRDGPAEEAQIASPHGVGVSPTGVIAVAEASNHTIRLLTPAGSPAARRGTPSRPWPAPRARRATPTARPRRRASARRTPRSSTATPRSSSPTSATPASGGSGRGAWRRWPAPRRGRSPTRWTWPSPPTARC